MCSDVDVEARVYTARENRSTAWIRAGYFRPTMKVLEMLILLGAYYVDR
jgi:hypothetical protein